VARIYELKLGKRNIASIPLEERRLLLLLGHAANEINVMQKFMIVSLQVKPDRKFADHIQAGQTLILLRALVGKLHEAWDLFKKRFQAEGEIRDFYSPKLDKKAQDALTQLNKHFGPGSPLSDVRNRFSFHYRDDHDLVEKSFNEIPEEDEWSFYLSNILGNSFYYVSELVITAGVTKLAEPNDEAGSYFERSARAFARLCDVTIEVANHIMTLFGECIAQIVTERLPNAELMEPVEIDAQALTDMSMPFFIDEKEFTPDPSTQPTMQDCKP
jgi:hypothetical protein